VNRDSRRRGRRRWRCVAVAEEAAAYGGEGARLAGVTCVAVVREGDGVNINKASGFEQIL
jgi:hypothetical protein